MYNCVFDINGITLVTLESKCPPNKLDFLILLAARYIIPNKINNNILIIYHCILHAQDISWNPESAAFVPLIHCRVIFATNVFSFECLHTT